MGHLKIAKSWLWRRWTFLYLLQFFQFSALRKYLFVTRHFYVVGAATQFNFIRVKGLRFKLWNIKKKENKKDMCEKDSLNFFGMRYLLLNPFQQKKILN